MKKLIRKEECCKATRTLQKKREKTNGVIATFNAHHQSLLVLISSRLSELTRTVDKRPPLHLRIVHHS